MPTPTSPNRPQEAFLIAACRTPVGAFLGGLSTLSAPELGAIAIREALRRAEVRSDEVEDVIMGNVVSAGLSQAPARQAALKGGLPESVSAVTVNKVCGSGLQAIMFAAQAIRAGDARIVVAGGMESMSRAPHVVFGARQGVRLGDMTLKDAMVLDGLTCPFDDCHMGKYAEYTARGQGISREDQDRYALESQQRAARAVAEGIFDAEIVPVTVKSRKGDVLVDRDECLRSDTDAAKLANLPAAFEREGSVTAGNASTLADGAAAVVVCDQATAQRRPRPWSARIVSYHTAGTSPRDVFLAPIAAVREVVAKGGLELGDIDLFEINEAFASQMLACIRALKIPREKVNIYGGGIALGHPIGASGARTVVTMLNALQREGARLGVVSLCLGGGNAVAMLLERVAS